MNEQTEKERVGESDQRLLGSRIRTARKEKGWTLKDLSERAEISIPFLSDIERGKANATFWVIATLARHLAMTVDSLIVGIDLGAKKGDVESEEARRARLRDIDAQIAYHLDGWRWMTAPDHQDKKGVMLQPPVGSKEWERNSVDVDCTELEDWETWFPRLQFWDRHGKRWNSRLGTWEFGFPHPTTDPVATAHVREWLRGQRYLVIQKEMPDGVSFRHDMTGADIPGFRSVAELHGGPAGVMPQKVIATGQTVEEAVCLVALQLIAIRKDS